MFSLNDGNQNRLIYGPTIQWSWLKSVQQKYSWEDFDPYENKLWEYMEVLLNPIWEDSTIIDREEGWLNLTRGQKLFTSFLDFDGNVNNGGVYQFFFNSPELLISVLEVWRELKLDKLEQDYEAVLNEILGKIDKFAYLKGQFDDESKVWEERWTSFTEGRVELPSAEKIEDYYYGDDFKKGLYKSVVDYIENNIEQFAVVETDSKS